MKKVFLLCILFFGIAQSQQTEYPVAIYLDGEYFAPSPPQTPLVPFDLWQMRDSLNLTWAEGKCSTYPYHTDYDINTAGIKIIAERDSILKITHSQRMVYEAEKTPPTREDTNLYNYFGNRNPNLQPGGDGISMKLNASGTSDTMFSGANPNSGYHQGQYYATFRLKIEKGSNPGNLVAFLSIFSLKNNRTLFFRSLIDSDFQYSLNYYEFELPFTSDENDIIDIRVVWGGRVTTYIDKVTIDDEVAKKLFAGGYDQTIRNEANDYLTNPTVQRLYFYDEPAVQSFLSYRYVDSILSNLFPPGTRGRGLTSCPHTGNLAKRFLQEARPVEFVSDCWYPIMCNVPSPSMTTDQASSVGVFPYDSIVYLWNLQASFDRLIERLRSVGELTKSYSTPFWFAPQLHGILWRDNGKYRDLSNNYDLRPPTGNEIWAQVNIAVAYGAKGIISFPAGTRWSNSGQNFMCGVVSGAVSEGKLRNHWSNIDTVTLTNGTVKTVYTGYKEKWDALAAVNKRLQQLGPTLATLNWLGTMSWYTHLSVGDWQGLYNSSGSLNSIVTKNSSGVQDDNIFVEIGHFRGRDTIDFFYVVNRRTLMSEGRNVFLTFNSSTSLMVTDVLTGVRTVIPANGTFQTGIMNPGVGKLYRIENYFVTISGPTRVTFPAKGETKHTYVWKCAATGGKKPFSYKWYKTIINNPKMPVGSDSLYTEIYNYSSGTPSPFTLQVLVTDANNCIAIDSFLVNYGLLQKNTINIENNIPTSFAIYPNFPNPFNPETNIKFDLPEPSQVKIIIYDVLGREVTNIFDGTKPAGYHSVRWEGSKVGSGIYFCRINITGESSKQFNKVIKMLLLK